MGSMRSAAFWPGAVAVEEALHLGMVAAQERQLAVGDRGALRRDGGLEAHRTSSAGRPAGPRP